MAESVCLDGYEHVVASGITEYRRKKNRRDGRKDQLASFHKMEPEEIEWHSYGAELAACKALNVFPDFSVELENGIGAPDLVLRDGRTVDVKWGMYGGPYLNVYSSKARRETQEDVYIYVVGRMPDYEVVGWALRAEVFCSENATKGRNGREYWRVHRDKLHPMEELK